MLAEALGLSRRANAIAPSPGREAALAWASLAQRSPASSVLAREGAGCGSKEQIPRLVLISCLVTVSKFVKPCAMSSKAANKPCFVFNEETES